VAVMWALPLREARHCQPCTHLARVVLIRLLHSLLCYTDCLKIQVDERAMLRNHSTVSDACNPERCTMLLRNDKPM
jgi:hypothetical protein